MKTKGDLRPRVTVDGMMVFDVLDNGLRTADFECCEDVMMEPFCGQCKVQMMRDGNVYITEQKKRVRNKPLFREDNSSLSQGQDGRWYFVFSLDEERVAQLPELLLSQATVISAKLMEKLNIKN